MASLGSRLLGVMRLFGMFGLFSEGGGVIGPHFVCVGRDLKPWQVFWAARAGRVWGGAGGCRIVVFWCFGFGHCGGLGDLWCGMALGYLGKCEVQGGGCFGVGWWWVTWLGLDPSGCGCSR